MVLQCREDARTDRMRLGPNVASCTHGPYERTRWIHNCDTVLTAGPVQIISTDSLRNFLQISVDKGIIRFPMFFGVQVKDEYFIHPDRDMKAYAESSALQFKLFDLPEVEVAKPDPGVWANYLLAIPTISETASFPFELHFIRGEKPERSSKFTSKVDAYDVHIVRMDDPSESLAPTFESPFDPETR